MALKTVLKAELLIQYWWLRGNRWLATLWVLWPYMAVIVLYVLGTSYGSLSNLARSVGVDDPILYLFAASNIAFTASGLIDTVTGIATWHRWIGTLPYVYLQPNRFSSYLVVSGMASSLFNILLNYLALLPGVIVYSGMRGGMGLTIVLLVLVLGSLPLVGIAVAAALASLIAREEGSILSFLNPFLLLLSGVFYPVTILPRILQLLSTIVPVTYVVKAARLASSFKHGPGAALYFAAYTLGLMIIVYNTMSLAVVERGEKSARSRGVIG